MAERICPGLPAEWLNGWLAALGATVAVPGMTLRWTDDAEPVAVLALDGDVDPAEALADAWPTPEWIEGLPIANLTRQDGVEQWRSAARASRSGGDAWTVTSIGTDAADLEKLTPSRLFVAAPGPGRFLCHRVELVAGKIEDAAREVDMTLRGVAPRRRSNGLGFDFRRVASSADEAEKCVTPCVEVLAFLGMWFYPVCGHERLRHPTAVTRANPSNGPFSWIAWTAALDRDAIDAILDVARDDRHASRLGISAAWESVSLRVEGADPTRAFASRRIR
ncbi:MAG TPA: hypothetical protein VHA73_02455 [Acidimicrobiales bacterium]|nr:hypothetical protein [Acidimicrobiales bacterium]